MSFKEAELRCIREAPPPNLTESSNCFMCCLVTGCTALHAAAAAEEGNAQIVELLLAARATVNLQDKEGSLGLKGSWCDQRPAAASQRTKR